MKVTCATLIETTVYARSVLTMASNCEFRVANLPTTSIDCRQRNRWERSALGVSGTGYERGHDISHRKSPGRPQAIAAGNPRNVSVHARVRDPFLCILANAGMLPYRTLAVDLGKNDCKIRSRVITRHIVHSWRLVSRQPQLKKPRIGFIVYAHSMETPSSDD